MDIAELIESHRTPGGGWTKKALAALGVPWPPPRGWKRRLLRRKKVAPLYTYDSYMRSKAWKQKRAAKLKSVGHRCENITCRSPLNLECHHKTYDRLGREKMSDLRVLCFNCHMDAHDNLPFPKRFYVEE